MNSLVEETKDIKQQTSSTYFKKEMEALKREVTTIKTSFQKEVSDIKMTINNITPSFADVVKNLENEASNIKQKLQQLKTVVKDMPKLETNDMEPTINEMQDRERRAYNVLVFGVDKDTNNNERDRTSSDMTTIKNILTKVSTGTDTEKIRILRLGKYEPLKKDL